MATQVDPLRSTLDHLALDPRARTDRPYLITMLRRLGYSEAEIAAYLGEEQPKAEAPTPEPLPEPEPIVDESGERVIEIEYTGPGLRDFQLVVPMDATEFDLDDPLGLGAGLEAGTMTIEGDPDEDELEAFLSGEGAVAMDSEFASDDEEFEAESDRDNDDINVRGDDDEDEFMSFDDDEDEMETVEMDGPKGDDDEFDPEMLGESTGGDDEDTFDADEAQVGKKMVEFQSVPMQEAKVRKIGEGDAAAAAPVTFSSTPAEPAAEAVDEWPADNEEAAWADAGDAPDGYWYGDWLLHSREEEREDGSWHRVYFFAKGQSPNGDPAQLPDGYEVAVHQDNGLPYLKPSGDVAGSDAPKKRVRMRRVTATSKEEAEAQVRAEGRNVLGSAPVDVQEHEEGEEGTP